MSYAVVQIETGRLLGSTSTLKKRFSNALYTIFYYDLLANAFQ